MTEHLKVVTALEMARIEGLACAEGASESEFMEKAGASIAAIVEEYVLSHNIDKTVTLLVGKGNNGGDAYVAGVHLLKKGYAVQAQHLYSLEQCGPLCKQQHEKFVKAGGRVHFVHESGDIHLPAKGILLDGLVGTGFKGKAEGPLAEAIGRANQSGLPIIAIDIPSGLCGNTGAVGSVAIVASLTIYLELPKIGFFLKNGWSHVGGLVQGKFGLKSHYLKQADAEAYLQEEKTVAHFLPKIERDRHKYEAGYVLAIAGSSTMPGAALLSCLAALRAGAGIVRLFHPFGMEEQLSNAPLELIKEGWDLKDGSSITQESKRAKASLVGPGLGREKDVKKMLKTLLSKLDLPTVLDADALYFIAENPSWKLPKVSILTPHHGEMQRLLSTFSKKALLQEEFIFSCSQFAEKKKSTLVVKGAPTFIFHPGKLPLIVTAGDPGMATAGTGDVLTGILAALLAQGLGPYEAAALGTYLHGKAGELAAFYNTSYCVIASDLLTYLPAVFSDLQQDIIPK